MQKWGMGFKKAAVTVAAVTTLFSCNPFHKLPASEQQFGKKEGIARIAPALSHSLPSVQIPVGSKDDVIGAGKNNIPQSDSICLRKVPLSDLDAKTAVLLEHHKNASNRIAFAQLMLQKPDAAFYSEFFDLKWQDSVDAYLRQPSDTLSHWLNASLYSMSYDYGAADSIKIACRDNHSYGKLVLAAKKSGCTLKGFNASYQSYDAEHTVHGLDSLYSLEILKNQDFGKTTSFILVGAWHFGLKERLQKHKKNIAGGKDAVNVLVWDSQLSPIRTTQIGEEDFKVRFNERVSKPLIKLNLPTGLYRVERGSKYAAGYGIDYILVVDSDADLPMPPAH